MVFAPLAVVFVDRPDHGPTEALKPLYQGDAVAVKSKWEQILDYSSRYPWAEPRDFDVSDRLVNFPRSIYNPLLTNSRTYIFQMVKKAGLTWSEMSGGKVSHPGSDEPSQNTTLHWFQFNGAEVAATFESIPGWLPVKIYKQSWLSLYGIRN